MRHPATFRRWQPAQLDAVTPTTRLVTISAGAPEHGHPQLACTAFSLVEQRRLPETGLAANEQGASTVIEVIEQRVYCSQLWLAAKQRVGPAFLVRCEPTMGFGALHYLVKPVDFGTLHERLTAYAYRSSCVVGGR